jgi:hypothetical protein
MSDPPRSEAAPRGLFQLRLSTLLAAMLLIAVGLAWLVDHRSQQEQIRQLKLSELMYLQQFKSLKSLLARQHLSSGFSPGLRYWSSPDDFLAALKQSDENSFFEVSQSIGPVDSKFLADVMAGLEKMLEDPDPEIRRRAVVTLSFNQQRDAQRLDPFVDALVAKLTPLVHDPDSGVQGETIGLLGLFGPRARPALVPLKARMLDDKDPNAPWCARTVKQIDPSVDIGPRLIEFIERKHIAWFTAAVELPKHVSPEVARAVISKRYDAAENDGDRRMAVQALNHIDPTSAATPSK